MTMRLAGITGMFDTDAMVKAELEPYKLKVQTKTQERDLLGIKQKQYRSVLKDIKDFYSKYISTAKSDSLMLASSYKSLKFTASNGSTAVTATANSTATMSNYNVSVSQLASGATTTFSDTDLSSKVNPASGATKGVIYINSGASATGSDVYVDIVSDVKKDSSGSYYVDSSGKKIIKQSDNITFKYEDGTAVASSNIQYAVDMKKTAENLNSKLSAGNLGIKATYSEYSKGIVLESSEMGSGVKFSAMFADFSDITSNSGDSTAVANASQLTTKQKTYIKDEANKVANNYIFTGKNLHAQITKVSGGISSVYNISDTDNATNVNNKTIDGVTFQFNDKTTSTATTTKYITSSSITSLLGNDITKTAQSNKTEYTLTNGSKISISNDGTTTITKNDGTLLNPTDSVSITGGDGVTRTIKGDGTLTTSTDPTITKYITSSSITSLLGNDITKTAQFSKTEYTLKNGSKVGISNDGTTTITKSDGTTLLNPTDSVSFPSADGVTKTINGDGTLTTGVTDNAVTLTGSKDVTAIKDKIVSFVNDYNTLITNLNTKLLEKRDKTYMPLTDEQKKDMSDDDVKLWNEKVNIGLLRKDNDLQRIANEMKKSMRTLISDSGLKLENIGITPVNNYTTLNGTFIVNEDKLTTALENNMDGVKGLFLKDSNNSQDYENNGILTSLKAIVETEVTSSSAPLVKKMGLEGSISDETSLKLDKMKTQLDEMNTSLITRENNLYTKYARLESAMNSIQSQETWLSQQFSS